MKVFILILGLFLFAKAQDFNSLNEDLNNIEICATLNNVNRTFANIWEIYNVFKTTGQVWTPVARGACPVNIVDCMTLNPVCAITQNFFLKTFPNKCILDAEQRKSGMVWRILHNGICPEKEVVAPIPKPSTPKPTPGKIFPQPQIPVPLPIPPPVSVPAPAPKQNNPIPSLPYSSTSQQEAYGASILPPTNNYFPVPVIEPIPLINKYINEPIIEPLPPKTEYIAQPVTNYNSNVPQSYVSPNLVDPLPPPPSNYQQPSSAYPSPTEQNYNTVPSQTGSQSPPTSQLYAALANFFESLPKQSSSYYYPENYLPPKSYLPAAVPEKPDSYQPQETYSNPEPSPSYSNSPQIYEPPTEQTYSVPEVPPPYNTPAVEIPSPSYSNPINDYVEQPQPVYDAKQSCAQNYEATAYSPPAESPYEVPSAAEGYEDPSYVAVDDNPSPSYPSTGKSYEASSYSAAAENPSPSYANGVENYEAPSYAAVANPSPSYAIPAESYAAPSYTVPAENPSPSYESPAYAAPIDDPSYSAPEVPSYSAPEAPSYSVPSPPSYPSSETKCGIAADPVIPEDSYQAPGVNYDAPAEEPSPTYGDAYENPSPSYASNYDTPSYSAPEIPAPSYEEVESPSADLPCSNSDNYSSPVLEYNNLPSYAQNSYEPPAVSEPESYNAYDNAEAPPVESPAYENAETNYQPQSSPQNSDAESPTVYNGVVYQGPYHYEPKYKHINYGNFNFLPPQSQQVPPGVPALLPAYTYAALSAPQYNAYSSNNFEQFLRQLQYIATKKEN